MESNHEVVEAGVDYITATASSKAGFDEFATIGRFALLEETKAGNEVKSWSAEGYTGFSCGAAKALAKPGSMLLQFSSHLAAEMWPEVVQHATNVSRLDLQTTVRVNPPLPTLARLCARDVKRQKLSSSDRAAVRLITDDVSGDTCYIGRRVSDRYARIYDKHRESKDPYYLSCWRFELELKRRYAFSTATQLLESEAPEHDAFALVSTYMRGKGIRSIARTPPLLTRSARPRRSVDSPTNRRLAWLESQVRPTVAKLVEHGELEALLVALGLQQLVLSASPGQKEV